MKKTFFWDYPRITKGFEKREKRDILTKNTELKKQCFLDGLKCQGKSHNLIKKVSFCRICCSITVDETELLEVICRDVLTKAGKIPTEKGFSTKT